jgi:tRNA pseudouridine38-40 synthase
MLVEKFYYIIHLQFLGFRYHGWQKQPDVKTIQHMLDRTLNTVLEHDNFKTLGSSRTDAMVSANHHTSELFLKEEIDALTLAEDLNKNLPADIKVLKVEETDEKFNIINGTKSKEYHYFFSYGLKAHPFCSPFMANFHDDLNIELMIEMACLFEGEHNFKRYCYRPQNKTNFIRTVDSCELVENTILTANFFPHKSYVLKIKGSGFLHHQVRLMVGTLVKVGLGQISKEELIKSFDEDGDYPIGFIAPSSGLILHQINF